MASYGPRTTALVLLDDGVYEFTHDAEGHGSGWLCSNQRITIAEKSKIFSPANLRSTNEHEGYRKLVQHYIDRE